MAPKGGERSRAPARGRCKSFSDDHVETRMNSKWIDIAAPDGGSFGGYLSLPPAGRGPGIVLIQEIFGVNAHIRAVADQYAMDGFTVIAPDVFWRMQRRLDIGYSQADMETGIGLMQRMDFDMAVADLGAVVSVLRALPACTGRVASLGFCMGGLLAYLAAAHAGVDAAVCYYGGGIPNQLAAAADIRVPVLFHFAANDAHIPLEGVEKVKAAFAGRVGSAVHVYAGADHGFNCWERAAYRQPAAALARGRSLAFLATTIA
jgi:carboxymethylenebutenolidase